MNKELEKEFEELLIGIPKLKNHYENNANLSEALNYLDSFINEMTRCLENPKQYAKNYNKEIFYKYKHTLETTVKQALLKAQEQEKLLESGDLSDGSHTFNQLYSLICQISAALADKIQESNEHKKVIDIIKKKPNVVMAVKRYTTYGNFKANNMTSDISHEEFELVKRRM